MINVTDFKKGIIKLFAKGKGQDLPKNQKLRDIYFKTAALMLSTGKIISEKEANTILKEWLEGFSKNVELDHVSLRRELVDNGYIERDSANTEYQIKRDSQYKEDLFAADIVENIDPEEVVESYKKEVKERKRKYMNK